MKIALLSALALSPVSFGIVPPSKFGGALPGLAPSAPAAAAAKVPPLVKVEFTLVRGWGDETQGLFSSADLLSVQLEKVAAVRRGEPADLLHIVKRTATYPMGKVHDKNTGAMIDAPQAQGSSVVEEEV